MEPAGSADSRCTQPESIQEQLIQDYGLLLGLDRYRYRVSGIGRYSPVYRWVSVSADTYLSIGADTSSPVGRLPVSTVNTVAMHACIVSSLYRIFVHIPHIHIYHLHTPIPCTKSHFQYKKFVQSVSVSVSV